MVRLFYIEDYSVFSNLWIHFILGSYTCTCPAGYYSADAAQNNSAGTPPHSEFDMKCHDTNECLTDGCNPLPTADQEAAFTASGI